METLRPANAAELGEALAAAHAAARPLAVVGAGTKRALGRPESADATLDVSRLAGIESYEPAELVLTAGAATRMETVQGALVTARQMLAFEPPDLAPLFGGAAGGGTLGGALACNLAGPRRIKSGAARDHFLGFSGVSGRGEVFKGGGKVVKNVTGYDLPKLMAGSFGTLAVLDSVTVKVVPAPEKTRTLLVRGLDDAAAVALLANALNSPNEVSGAAHLPQAVAARSRVERVRGADAVTAIRVEGTGTSVAARLASLRALASGAALDELHTTNSAALWREVADVATLLPDAAAAIWRVSVPPAAGPEVAAAVAGDAYFDWGGGLVWLALSPDGDAGAAAIRAAVARAGGHATLIRAPLELRARVPVFEPLAGPLAALTARVKDAFDPARILNRGRMYADL
jgi:glycolate oxidase FAD binding subunit